MKVPARLVLLLHAGLVISLSLLLRTGAVVQGCGGCTGVRGRRWQRMWRLERKVPVAFEVSRLRRHASSHHLLRSLTSLSSSRRCCHHRHHSDRLTRRNSSTHVSRVPASPSVHHSPGLAGTVISFPCLQTAAPPTTRARATAAELPGPSQQQQPQEKGSEADEGEDMSGGKEYEDVNLNSETVRGFADVIEYILNVVRRAMGADDGRRDTQTPADTATAGGGGTGRHEGGTGRHKPAQATGDRVVPVAEKVLLDVTDSHLFSVEAAYDRGIRNFLARNAAKVKTLEAEMDPDCRFSFLGYGAPSKLLSSLLSPTSGGYLLLRERQDAAKVRTQLNAYEAKAARLTTEATAAHHR
eukprot:GHVU01021140.1.p1 GENE.GHVU01021140.1~~GHVU01021140.1.p1  ORF type:complete len:355 (-),score=41.45 GHVU01021140.1:144-1208(-)